MFNKYKLDSNVFAQLNVREDCVGMAHAHVMIVTKLHNADIMEFAIYLVMACVSSHTISVSYT